jgi:hypothetical protein
MTVVDGIAAGQKSRRTGRRWVGALPWIVGIIAGLVVVDILIQRLGSSLVNGHYTPDTTLNALISKNHDMVIVGGCRAALHLDPKIIGAITGEDTFNAGRVVDGVGFIDLAGHLALPRTKRLVIVMEINNWQETAEVDGVELEKYRVWKSVLESEYQRSFAFRYSSRLPWLNSGLLNFHGKGPDLVAASRAYLKGEPAPMKDAYDPRHVNAVPDSRLTDKVYIEKSIKRDFRVDPFALAAIDELISDAKRKGVDVILYLSPLHHTFAAEDANDKQVVVARELANKHRIRLLNYSGNNTEFAQRDDWWTDSGHMNRVGAEALSQIVARDLRN